VSTCGKTTAGGLELDREWFNSTCDHNLVWKYVIRTGKHRVSTCVLCKFRILNAPGWNKLHHIIQILRKCYHLYGPHKFKNRLQATSKAYFFSTGFMHWLFSTHLFIQNFLPKSMNVRCKRCFLSFPLIQLFIRNLLLREQHRYKGPWFCITNWSINAVYIRRFCWKSLNL
jgi:hypothetical protein